jgi:hypothetical protein
MEGLTDTSKTINDESASGSANQSSAANSLGKIYNLFLCINYFGNTGHCLHINN